MHTHLPTPFFIVTLSMREFLFIYLFIFRILSIFNTHTEGEGRNFFLKESYSGVYPKKPNSCIQNTCFKPLLLTLIFQCEINPLFFLLTILSIFNTHTHEKRRDVFFLKKLAMAYIQKGILLFHSI